MKHKSVSAVFNIVCMLVLIVMVGARPIGCSSTPLAPDINVKPQVCAAIDKGIVEIDSRLDKTFHFGKDRIIFGLRCDSTIKIRSRSLKGNAIFYALNEWWDSLSEEQKLAAVRELLMFIQDNWCATAEARG